TVDSTGRPVTRETRDTLATVPPTAPRAARSAPLPPPPPPSSVDSAMMARLRQLNAARDSLMQAMGMIAASAAGPQIYVRPLTPGTIIGAQGGAVGVPGGVVGAPSAGGRVVIGSLTCGLASIRETLTAY